jgi:hypothetical protein
MTSMPESIPLQQSEGSSPQGGASPLGNCLQITKGDYVEVKVGLVVHLTGHVVEVQPSMDLFWVLTPDGTRKIVELAEFDVYLAA